MLVGSVITAGKNLAPPALARSPSPSTVPQEAAKGAKPQDVAHMTEVVADIQKNLSMIHNVDLQFSVHEATGEIMVTVREESKFLFSEPALSIQSRLPLGRARYGARERRGDGG
jgi:hypothetical protein